MSGSPADSLLLPPRTRLLHIGPMKTGTTSLQAAAHARRKILLEHGVRYPGHWFNHRRELGALMGWSVSTWRRTGPLDPDLFETDDPSMTTRPSGIPPRSEWDRLKSEIDADQTRRILITHEFLSQADDATARRIVDAIGDPIHVSLTLRAPGAIVPSLWAQGIRDEARTISFDDWLGRLYGGDPDGPISARTARAYDQGQLVQRWARLVGPENVTVVVVNKSDPDLLTGSFEAMLGLPPGTLKWRNTNRSLSATDAELFRQVNAVLRERGADWRTFYGLVWKGAIRLGPERREPMPDEPRVLLPPWAGERASEDGRRFAEEIRDSGVRVAGNLDDLAAPTRTIDRGTTDEIPMPIAADSLAAALLAGQELRRRFEDQYDSRIRRIAELEQQLDAERSSGLALRAKRIPSNQRADQLAAAFGIADLMAALTRRVLRSLRTGTAVRRHARR